MQKRLPIELVVSIGVMFLVAMLWGVLATRQFTMSSQPTVTPSVPTVMPPTSTTVVQPPSDTPTSLPVTPTLIATPEVIAYFEVTPSQYVRVGSVLAVRWKVTGYVRVRVVEQLGAQMRPDARFWEVEPEGMMEIDGPTKYDDTLLYTLYVFDQDDTIVSSNQARVTLRCPHTWFFAPVPEGCPDAKAVDVQAVEQSFERGRMLWLSEAPWGGGPTVYVLYGWQPEGTMWRAYVDTWHEGMPSSDPEIETPLGLFQPLRRLGKVWREHEIDVREPLGWATFDERAYQVQFQIQSTDGRYPTLYVLSADAQVYVLHPGGMRWEVR
jgi:hypothetical protein